MADLAKVMGLDVVGGLTFTELDSAVHNASGAINTWEDWDVSGLVPAGTVAVLVGIYNIDVNALLTGGARKNGTALTRYFPVGWASHAVQTHILTECDANRIIDIYASNLGAVGFFILGYWS